MQETGLLEKIKMQKEYQDHKKVHLVKRSGGSLTDEMVVKALWASCTNNVDKGAAKQKVAKCDGDIDVDDEVDLPLDQ